MSEHAIAQVTRPHKDALRFPVLTRIIILACTASIIAGCSTNPIVRWDTPKTADVPEYTLGYGLTYAHRARNAYRDAIRSDTAASQSLSSGLITLGAAIAGLAAFKAHRDTIIGAGLIGGTAFALGNWNFSRQRLLIFQAGVAGINCSIEAVLPLYITKEDLKNMGLAVDDVDKEIRRVNNAIEALNAVMNDPKVATEKPQAEQLIKEARSLIDTGRASTLSARQFIRAAQQAGPALVAAVDRISNTIDKAVLETLPDLSAVPQVVSGLAGLAGSFAPGSGVEQHISAALKGIASAQSQTRETGPKTAAAPTIAKELNTLAAASTSLGAAIATLNGQLAGYDTTANTARLAGCGVTGIDSALKVTQPRIVVKTKTESTSLVRVSGGTATVYSGALLRQAEGLTVKNPLPGDRTFQIVTTKALSQTGDFPLLISDAAGKEITVMVVVEAANGAGEPPATTGGQPEDKKAAAAAFIGWLNSTGGVTVDLGDEVKASFKKAEAAGEDGAAITVSCPPPAKIKESDALSKFIKDNEKINEVTAASANKVKFTLKPEGESCIIGGAQSATRSAVRPTVGNRPMSDVEIQGVQRSLCLAESDVMHKSWGRKSKAALQSWRAKSGKAGSPTSLSAEEFAALAGGKLQAQCAK